MNHCQRKRTKADLTRYDSDATVKADFDETKSQKQLCILMKLLIMMSVVNYASRQNDMSWSGLCRGGLGSLGKILADSFGQ